MPRALGQYPGRDRDQPPYSGRRTTFAGPRRKSLGGGTGVTETRSGGVAPLAVLFDASAFTNANTTVPFHELTFLWNFGDSASTHTYGTAYNATNTDRGPITAHVYETAGTFTPVLTVYYQQTLIGTYNLTSISVQSADSAFPGATTVCVSTDGDMTGAPSGATSLNVGAAADGFEQGINALTGSVKRILFRAGQTFNSNGTGGGGGTTGTNARITATGPILIGKYGAGAKPIIAKSVNSYMLLLSSATTPTGVNDIRIVDLVFNGASKGDTTEAVAADGTCTQILCLRVDVQDAYTAFDFAVSGLDLYNADGIHPERHGHTLYDQISIVGCTALRMTGSGCTGFFAGASNLVFMGNSVNDTSVGGTAGHNIRINYGRPYVISHNTFQKAATSKHVAKIDGILTTATGLFTGLITKWGYFGANSCTGNTGDTIMLAFGPQVTDIAEMLEDLVIEGNKSLSGTGTQYHYKIWAKQRVTLRNNIMNLSSGSAHEGISVERRGTAPAPSPTNIWVYNNSCYNTDASFFAVIGGEATASFLFMYNNAGYSPSATTNLFYEDNGATNVTQSNNSTNAQVLTPDPFVDKVNYVPQNYALNGGTTILSGPYDDFSGTQRTGTMDMGAVNG